MKKINFICIAGCLFLAACGPQSDNGTVEWPELRAFDHQAERAEARVNAGADEEELNALSLELIDSANVLLNSRVPANVISRSGVDARLQDVRELLDELENEPASPDLLIAFHAVVHDLMESAGMPHVHDHDHDHSHSHADCCADDGDEADHSHEHDHHDPDHDQDHAHDPGHEHTDAHGY